MTSENPIIALVTGANKGIGYQVAGQLAERGMSVLAAARNEEKARAAAESLGMASGDVRPIVLDVVDCETIRAAARRLTIATGDSMYLLITRE